MQTFWLIVRCAIVFGSAVGALLGPVYMPGHLRAQWLMPLVGFLFFPVVVVVGLAVLFLVQGPRLEFTTPSWRTNPFAFSHPEQFFHLAAFVFLAQGVVLLARQAFAGAAIGAGAVAVLVTGCGVWLGLRILGLAYRMQSRQSF